MIIVIIQKESAKVMTPFVSLHNQTDFSILDSLISTDSLFNRAKELGQTAIAITDHGTLAAAWDALKASRKTGIKLIMGCECYFVDDAANITDKFRHVVLLAKNAVGYRNLLTLNKKGFDQGSFLGKRVYPIVDWKLLEQYSEGLICLTACGNGIINQLLMNKKNDEVEKTLHRLKVLFGENLGLEVQPNNMKRGYNVYNDEIDQQFLNRKLIDLGKIHGIKVVPACNTHYLLKEEADTHDVFLAIGSHQPKYSNFRLKYNPNEGDFYLKTGDEVASFFSRNYGEDFAKDICENSVWFADQCETPDWIDPKHSNPSGKELPSFPVKDEPDYIEFLEWVKTQDIGDLKEDDLYLKYKCMISFNKMRSEKPLYNENINIYMERINRELDVLHHQGFSSYMLLVADYVDWSKRNGITNGPGRGSCGGCFLAYLLGIHEADSIKYNLLFERFQNKERTEAPDIDQDVSSIHRPRVIEYICNKYGEDKVCSISNYNTITPKVYVRDISRSMELAGNKDDSVKLGNDLASVIPSDQTFKVSNFNSLVDKVPMFSEYCKKYPDLIKHSSILGKIRSLGTHAAAIVVGNRSLVGLIPLRKDKSGNLLIEYEKINTEQNGLIKMDILGISNLDTIDYIVSLIKKTNLNYNDEHRNYDAEDEKTYDLISKGNTFGVFQFGAVGAQNICRKVKPKNINDLAIITTLIRPAAKDIRDNFIATRNGKMKSKLLHPSLENAFAKTYGFGLFDESILQLGKDVAGWSLNSADRIRKMIKDKGKYPEKAKLLREEFIEGAFVTNNIDKIMGAKIWDEEIKKFGSYTFNCSHAVAYSMLSYQTAYLKANYTKEFLLGNLIAEIGSNSPVAAQNIKIIKNEIKDLNIKILPPNINTSHLCYTLLETGELLTGLDALKFVGDDAIKDIIEKRPFKNFFDFMVRVNSKYVRSNSIQALASSGALDFFKIPRKLIYLYCSDYRKKLQVWIKKHDPSKEEFVYPWPHELDWSMSEIYALEQFYLGESFNCKPCDAYGKFFKGNQTVVYEIKKCKDKTKLYDVKCIIKDFFEFKVKKESSKYYGQPMIKAIIEDKNGDQCSCTIFPDRWKTLQDRIKHINSKAEFGIGLALSFSGNTNSYEDDIGIILDDLADLAVNPALPADLKAKKINLKEAKAQLAAGIDPLTSIKNNEANLAEHIEDILYDEGLIDLDDESFED